MIGYLDDITLGGDEQTLVQDVQQVRSQGEAIGLKLNASKCEFIGRSAPPAVAAFADFIPLQPNSATLLGAPLNTGSAMDVALSARCSELALAVERLKLLSSHDALILLRASFSAPKVLHTLRSSPCVGNLYLDQFDNHVRRGLHDITNSNLSDMQWIQASLPVKDGGLGIRRVSSLAPSAFMASAASTLALQDLILARCGPCPDSSVRSVGSFWSGTHNIPHPTDTAAAKQAAWDAPCIEADKSALRDHAMDSHHRARLLAVTAPHAGDWLHALPISSCGLRLDDETIRVSVGLRLGLNLCEPHRCPCGLQVDSRGTHGLSCKLSSGRMARHHHINDLIWRSLSRAGIPSTKEPTGLVRADGKRPDGLTLIPWQGGKNLTWDVTVADTLAASHLATTSRMAGSAAESASTKKESKYQELARTFLFTPIAIETLGPINSKATTFLVELGRRIAAVTGDIREGAFLFQRLSVAIQRFNCICFKGSFASIVDEE